MSEEELREKIEEIVYVTRWNSDKTALVAVLKPEEYIQIENGIINLINKIKSNEKP
jgi:hypothetical protein